MENEEENVGVPTEEEEGSETDWSDLEEDKGKSDLVDDDQGDESDSNDSVSENGSEMVSSDDSDGMSEKCAICLQKFLGQEIGTPETCEHHFCLKCITEWSKKVATCPVDRKLFPAILVKNELFGQVVRIQDVDFGSAPNTTTDFDEYDPDPTYCEICGHCDREDRLLLCDGCDLGYHLECLDPPMDHVPIEDWYCSTCQVQSAADVSPGSSQRPSRRQLRLPRTGQSRRILESIRRSTYQVETSSVENNTPTRTVRRKRTTRKASGRKTKRGSKRRKLKSSGTKGKRRSKKGRKSRVVSRPSTTRARLAHQLGILPPRPGQVYVGLPRCRAPVSQSAQSSSSSSSLHNLRYQAGITPLRIYSTSEDLADYLESYSDEEGSVGVARVQGIHRLGNPCKPSIVNTARSHLFEAAQASSSPDILGPILNNQIIMFTDRNIHIKRDGTLVPSITPTQSTNPPPTCPPPSVVTAGSSPSRRNSPKLLAHNHINTTTTTTTFNFSRNSRRNLGDLRVPSANNNILNTPLNSYPSLSTDNTGARQVPISPNSNESSTGTSSSYNSSNNNNNDSTNSSSTAANIKDGDNTSSSQQGSVWNSNSHGSDLYSGQNISGPPDQDPSKAYENYLYSNNKANNNMKSSSENSDKNKSNASGGSSSGTNEVPESKDNEHNDDDEEYNIYSDIEEDVGNDENHEGFIPATATTVKPVDSGDVGGAGSSSIKERGGDSDSEMVIDDDYRVGMITSRERGSHSSVESPALSEDTLTMNTQKDVDHNKSYSPEYLPSPTSIPLPDSPPPLSDEDDDERAARHCDPLLVISSPETDSDFERDTSCPSRAKYDPSQPLTSSDEEEHSIKLTRISTPKKKKSRPQTQNKAETVKSSSSKPAATSSERAKVAVTPPCKPPPKVKAIVAAEEEEEEEEEELDVDLNSIPIPPMPTTQEDYTRRPTIQFSIPTRHRLLPISSLIKRQKGVMRKETKGGNTLSFSSEISKAFGEEKMDESEEESNRLDGQESRVSLVAEIFGSDDENEEDEQQQQQSITKSSSTTTTLEDTQNMESTIAGSALPNSAIENVLPADLQGPGQSTNDYVIGPLDSCRWKKSVVEQERHEETTTTTVNTDKITTGDQQDVEKLALPADDTSIAGEESDDSVSVLETIMNKNVAKRKNTRNHHHRRRRNVEDDDDVVLLSTVTGVTSNKDNRREIGSSGQTNHETSVLLSSRRPRTTTTTSINPTTPPIGSLTTVDKEKTPATTVLESISEVDSEFAGDSSREELSSLSARNRQKTNKRLDREKDNNNKEKEKMSKEKDKDKKIVAKRKRSASPLSNCEEGEIVDSPEKRRKKKKKKTKRRKKSKDSKSSRIDFSEKILPEVVVPAHNSSSEDNAGDNLGISWKKPSSSTKERNYRDGKPKPEENYFKARDKKHDASPHDRRDKHNNRDKSPLRDKTFNRGKNDTKRSRRRSSSLVRRRSSRSKSRSIGWRSRSRSVSKSKINDRRFNSRSNRSSSSSKSFRSRSRSRSLRHSRRHRRLSISPRRSRSLSRTPVRLRSRSPLKRAHNNRKKSLSSSRSRRFRPRQRSASSISSSASTRRDDRRKKRKEKVHGGDKLKKRKEKDKVVRDDTRETSIREKEKEHDKDKDKKRRRRRREKSVSPAKAIFADGDSIVVSLNFQKANNSTSGGGSGKDTGSPTRNESESDKKKSGRRQRRGRSTDKDENSSKPRLLKKTLLIDLETSPIQEQNIGVSPTLIVLSDEEHNEEQSSLTGKGSERGDMDSMEMKDGVAVTTSGGDGGPNEGCSPYRHGVAADSTQIQQPNQSDSKMDDSYNGSNRTPNSPYEDHINSLTPTRGDALVTSTRDSEICLPHDNDSRSPPTTPPPPLPLSSTDSNKMLHQIHPRSPPPLSRVTSPPPLSSPQQSYLLDTRNNDTPTNVTPSSSVSNGQTSGLVGKPLTGIGNIPGLFPPTNASAVSLPPPVVIPAPPTPQQIPRFTSTSSVNQNLLTSNVLASVAALYGPLMAVRQQQQQHQQQQQQQSTLSGKFSNANVIGHKVGQQSGNSSSVLLPKNQISHGHGNRSKSGHFTGGGDSPFSPNSSDGDDLFEPPLDRSQMDSGGKSDKLNSIGSQGGASNSLPILNAAGGNEGTMNAGVKSRDKNSLFDTLFGTTGKKSSAPANHQKSHDKSSKSKGGSHHKSKGGRGAKKDPPKQLSEGELRLTEDVPTSAVELRVKEKFLKKLNRQERVVEEVKLSLKPHYSKKHVTKDEYKEILRRAVPKICHNKTGEINPFKIKELVEAYVKKFRHSRKIK